MSPVNLWITTSRMKKPGRSGVKSQARRLNGSASSCAGLTSGASAAGVSAAGESPPGRRRCTGGGPHRRTPRRGRPIERRTAATSASEPTPRLERQARRGQRVRSVSADRVVAAGVPRVAAGDPPGAHPGAPEEAVLLDRLLGVARAGRLVAAARRAATRTGSDRRGSARCRPASRDSPAPPSTPPRCEEFGASAPTRSRWSALDDRRPGDDQDVPAGLERGRHRPDRLAEPSPDAVPDHGAAERRPVARPNRVVSRSVRRNRAARSGWDRMVPAPGAPRSPAGERASRAAAVRAAPAVRPSGASDRGPGVRPGRGVRPSSSCGRGSRAPWRDGASWAGRSASSGLRAILSIRPRGSSVIDPGRHANAPSAR